MSVRRLHEDQPEAFAFTSENMDWAKGEIAKFPEGRQASAVIPLLWKAQEQNEGWLPEPAIRAVADLLGMPYIRALEVATFYTMFNLEPVGRHLVQLCGTTPCMLRGSDELKAVCRRAIGPEKTVSEDGALSWMEVECLGACVNAPMVQIGKDYYEDLTAERFEEILTALREGRDVPAGPQVERQFSAPQGGATTLTDDSLYPASGKAPKRKGAKAGAGDVAAKGRGEATAKPDPEPRPEEAAADTPADRAAEGKTAVSENDRAEAAKVESRSGAPDPAKQRSPAPEADAPPKPRKPRGLKAPRKAGADDLTRITGIGPKLAEALNGAGIYHFDQIAAWTEENLAWIDANLEGARGRPARDGWVEQAKVLSNEDSSDKGEGKE